MNIVAQIMEKRDLSKYRIAKILCTSWNTVQMWYREVYVPTDKSRTRLERILNGNDASDELLRIECKEDKETRRAY